MLLSCRLQTITPFPYFRWLPVMALPHNLVADILGCQEEHVLEEPNSPPFALGNIPEFIKFRTRVQIDTRSQQAAAAPFLVQGTPAGEGTTAAGVEEAVASLQCRLQGLFTTIIAHKEVQGQPGRSPRLGKSPPQHPTSCTSLQSRSLHFLCV